MKKFVILRNKSVIAGDSSVTQKVAESIMAVSVECTVNVGVMSFHTCALSA
jgi:hypothetical protein